MRSRFILYFKVRKIKKKLKDMTKITLIFLILFFCVLQHQTVHSFPARRELTYAQYKRMMEAYKSNDYVFGRKMIRTKLNCKTEKQCYKYQENGIIKEVCYDLEDITCR